MRNLRDLKVGSEAVVTSISGDVRYLSRITSIGITPGCRVRMLKNDKNRPLLIFSRDTMIALNKKESESILIEEETKAL
ncbi:MAG: ferrous iron transport protein A [Lachnospiraceae bacterium]|nr:ferrous iron transport protein A [Lachnospiraceae bacterium]